MASRFTNKSEHRKGKIIMNKKIISIVLTGVMLFSMTGCKNNNEDKVIETTETDKEANILDRTKISYEKDGIKYGYFEEYDAVKEYRSIVGDTEDIFIKNDLREYIWTITEESEKYLKDNMIEIKEEFFKLNSDKIKELEMSFIKEGLENKVIDEYDQIYSYDFNKIVKEMQLRKELISDNITYSITKEDIEGKTNITIVINYPYFISSTSGATLNLYQNTFLLETEEEMNIRLAKEKEEQDKILAKIESENTEQPNNQVVNHIPVSIDDKQLFYSEQAGIFTGYRYTNGEITQNLMLEIFDLDNPTLIIAEYQTDNVETVIVNNIKSKELLSNGAIKVKYDTNFGEFIMEFEGSKIIYYMPTNPDSKVILYHVWENFETYREKYEHIFFGSYLNDFQDTIVSINKENQHIKYRRGTDPELEYNYDYYINDYSDKYEVMNLNGISRTYYVDNKPVLKLFLDEKDFLYLVDRDIDESIKYKYWNLLMDYERP